MPFIKLQFKPGLNRDQTNYSGEGGWFDCDKIRFRSGYPEKIGGWKKATPNTFLGVCRQMWNWITSFSDNFLAIGTNKKVYIEAGGYFYDITPLQGQSTVGAIAFTATNGSSTITVADTTVTPTYSIVAGSYVTFSGAASLGGNVTATILNQNFEIATTINATHYTITVPVVANASDSGNGGASVQASYEIEPGNAIATAGYGWGTGTWGRLEWGLGSISPVFLPQRDWWFDNFDNDLVMNIRNGPIYYWERGGSADPSTALDTRAELLSEFADAAGYDPDAVPAATMQILISQQDKHLIAFGCVPYGSTSVADFDPLLIRWPTQDNPFEWTPSPTNTAGFLRVSRGSRIVRALPTRQEIVVWTDTHLYTLQFLGTTDVFSLQEYADNISIASPRACASASNITYWMGQDKFYAYTGRVETLACSIRNYVFQDINFNQSDQIICGTNEQWNEIWWFYPSANSNWNDRYVVYNHLERLWYYGTIDRTAWLDTPLRTHPQAATSTQTTYIGSLYSHEDGVDDDVIPMTAYIQSNDFDLEDGEKFLITRRIIPDVNFDGSSAATPEIDLVIRPRNFPGSTYQSDTADTQRVVRSSVNVYTDQVFVRARARQMALKVMSDQLGVQWQLGSPRLDARPDGKR